MIISYSVVDETVPAFKEPKDGDAGYDLYARETTWIWPWKVKKVPANLKIEIPKGFNGEVRGRSGQTLAGKLVGLGTVDASYRGEISVMMYSVFFPRRIKKGERIAQLVMTPCAVGNQMVRKEYLNTTERGSKGFGDSGKF